jgi:hypothetical protein
MVINLPGPESVSARPASVTRAANFVSPFFFKTDGIVSRQP